MLRVALLAALVLAAGACGGGRIRIGDRNALNYAQYQSLEKGMTADAVLKAFGPPTDTLEQSGAVRGLTYPCENAVGQVQQLRMVFGPDERLERWLLTGEPRGRARNEEDDGLPLDTD